MAPDIFEREGKDGTRFKCSDAFVRTFLHKELKWSQRRATKAARKEPENWEELCEKARLRIAYAIKEEDVPACLIVNSDQTGVTYAPGAGLSWAKTGSKQVSTVGEEEKRAFTAMLSCSAGGFLLPIQAIYQGGTQRSCPKPDAPHHADAIRLHLRFEYSETKTHWANQKTMRLFVEHILVPLLRGNEGRAWSTARAEVYMDHRCVVCASFSGVPNMDQVHVRIHHCLLCTSRMHWPISAM